jgi:trk system potassium uptake protein TrkA
MSINKTYAVFGLGRYGIAVARELAANGIEVLAIDNDEGRVSVAAADIPLCKCADITDPEVIKQLGIGNIDVVIIAMASNLEASVMAIMQCKASGVKTVVAKCANEMHKEIFSRVGADKVVFPEYESGVRLAKNLLSSGFIDVVELSNDVSVIELAVKPEWVGKTLSDLHLRKKYGLNVIAFRNRDSLQINIDPLMQLDKDMQLVVITNTSKIEKLK